jgi:hypothetical protein
MAFVQAIMLGYEKYGVDPSRALREAQITPAQLKRADARITAAQMEAISGAAMQELDDGSPPTHRRRRPEPGRFPGPVRFDAAHAGFSFDAQYLSLPLRRDERALRTMLQRALHVSTRTLHRQLQEEGAALQDLKDEVRRDQAIDQLCRTKRSVKQIARAVGFGNEKSFARAFRQWTGASPSEYRRNAAVA